MVKRERQTNQKEKAREEHRANAQLTQVFEDAWIEILQRLAVGAGGFPRESQEDGVCDEPGDVTAAAKRVVCKGGGSH